MVLVPCRQILLEWRLLKAAHTLTDLLTVNLTAVPICSAASPTGMMPGIDIARMIASAAAATPAVSDDKSQLSLNSEDQFLLRQQARHQELQMMAEHDVVLVVMIVGRMMRGPLGMGRIDSPTAAALGSNRALKTRPLAVHRCLLMLSPAGIVTDRVEVEAHRGMISGEDQVNHGGMMGESLEGRLAGRSVEMRTRHSMAMVLSGDRADELEQPRTGVL